MSWEVVRNLTAGRPRLAVAVTSLSLLGAAAGAVANYAQVSELLRGADAPIDARTRTEIEAREAKAIEAATSAAQARGAAEMEAKAWTAAQSANTAAAYEFYLQAFPNGLFHAEAETAKARLVVAAATPTTPATAVLTSKPLAKPFDLAALHPTIASAAATARKIADAADDRLAEAEQTASRAQAAAEQAKARQKGFETIAFKNGDRYDGAVARRQPNGLGVFTQGQERFQGQLVDGRWSGVGVYEYAASGGDKPVRYGGEVQAGRLTGTGVAQLKDGARLSGAMSDGTLNGYGIETFPDGRRLEGEFKNGAANGYCVLWSAEGHVIEAGRYETGALVQKLTL